MFLPFRYYDPVSLADFIAIAQQCPQYQILAGGTDVLVKMRNGWQPCEHLIDIKKIADIPQMNKIEVQETGIILGSLVTFTEIKNHPVIREKFTALYDASCVMGCLEIRNRATMGGNICNAAAGAEGGSTMLIFDTQVHIAGKSGVRTMPLSEFYQVVGGKPAIALKPGELVTHFFLPFLPPDSASTYLRRSRSQGMDLATLNLALAILHSKTESERKFRIAGGAIGPIPYRFLEVEAKLSGQPLSESLIAQAKKMLSELSNPRSGSKRGSVGYKKDQIAELFEISVQHLLSSQIR